MAYPATIWTFDETKIINLLNEMRTTNVPEFLDKYKKEIKETIEDWEIEDFQEEIQFFKDNELQEGDAFIEKLIRLSGGKEIDLSEFSYFQYAAGFYDYLKAEFEKNSIGSSTAKEGFKLLTNFLRNPPSEMFGIQVSEENILGYANENMVQKEGKAAIKMLSDIQITAENKLIFDNRGWHDSPLIDSYIIEFYKEGRDKLVNALQHAIKNKMAIAISIL
ncbi:hypothetical protein J4450_06380 [Candidatus Micrarchaeota archaeon]|nr:hypothetical protein [Candidatus Micrarchaeota archaeon]